MKNEFYIYQNMAYRYEPYGNDIIFTPTVKKWTNNILKIPVSSYFPKYLINSYLTKDGSYISIREIGCEKDMKISY